MTGLIFDNRAGNGPLEGLLLKELTINSALVAVGLPVAEVGFKVAGTTSWSEGAYAAGATELSEVRPGSTAIRVSGGVPITSEEVTLLSGLLTKCPNLRPLTVLVMLSAWGSSVLYATFIDNP